MIFQSLWIGNRLSKMEQLSLCSFLSLGHTFHLYTYDEIDNVPPGVIVKDASSILPSSRIFKYKGFNSYAGFANLFRYKLILEKGGYWVDTDIVCLRKITKKQKYVFASQNHQDEYKAPKVVANNCVIKAPKHSEIMEYCFEQANRRNPETLYWGETGPILLTRALIKFNLSDYVVAPRVFCPIPWFEWRRIVEDEAGDICENFENSFCIHLWHEMWRRNGIDKSANFSKNCIYEKLKYMFHIV
ncbi:glycosyltransferase [Chryseolinea sp. H1M3-3]|uniref:glycosyltransferase n=1 Tax=Chryseolinea sp. H1M3-3 TaxID=3034144 RepID=UPI0023EB1904|nr:glycosyltransferase [Chryseolinea sp. H1M3-3]